MQLDKGNSRDKSYIQKEYGHNAISLIFSIIGLMTLLMIMLYSITLMDIVLIVYASIFSFFMLVRVLINIRMIILFERLVKKTNPEHIEIYITKSWTRKREGAIWVGAMYIITLLLLLLVTMIAYNFYPEMPILLTSMFIAGHILIIIIYMFTNIQTLDNKLKMAKKRINLEDLEWEEIRRFQSSFYKQLFIWYIHIIFILPLVLMVFPNYRGYWNDRFSK